MIMVRLQKWLTYEIWLAKYMLKRQRQGTLDLGQHVDGNKRPWHRLKLCPKLARGKLAKKIPEIDKCYRWQWSELQESHPKFGYLASWYPHRWMSAVLYLIFEGFFNVPNVYQDMWYFKRCVSRFVSRYYTYIYSSIHLLFWSFFKAGPCSRTNLCQFRSVSLLPHRCVSIHDTMTDRASNENQNHQKNSEKMLRSKISL